MMYRIDGRGTTTHSAWRLLSRQLRCLRGCSSSPRWGGIADCLILPYIFLRRTQPTTTPQRPSTRRDVNCRQRPQWCPTPSTTAYNSRPSCLLIVVCGGARSEAPWRLWDDGGRHGRWVHGYLVVASFYLAKRNVTKRNNQSIMPNQRFPDCNPAEKYMVTSGSHRTMAVQHHGTPNSFLS